MKIYNDFWLYVKKADCKQKDSISVNNTVELSLVIMYHYNFVCYASHKNLKRIIMKLLGK